MADADGVTRRGFVGTAGGAALLALAPRVVRAAAAGERRRYAIVGTGVRGIGVSCHEDRPVRIAELVDL